MARKGKTQESNPRHEWCVLVEVDHVLSGKPYQRKIVADERERKDLARRMQIESIDSVEADLTLTRAENSRNIHVTGTLKADLAQLCVVSLEPVPEHIDAVIEAWFVDESDTVSFNRFKKDRQKATGREAEMKEEQDDPEVILDGQIDIGELAAQHLSLNLNPYPHKDGIEYTGPAVDDVLKAETPSSMKNPFAALKEWKDKRDREKEE